MLLTRPKNRSIASSEQVDQFDAARALSDAAANNMPLDCEDWELVCNSAASQAMSAPTPGLQRHCIPLKRMTLHGHAVAEAAGIAIAGALQSNSTLEFLDLFMWTDLTEAVGIAFADALRANFPAGRKLAAYLGDERERPSLSHGLG